jgi:hypothetical protein
LQQIRNHWPIGTEQVGGQILKGKISHCLDFGIGWVRWFTLNSSVEYDPYELDLAPISILMDLTIRIAVHAQQCPDPHRQAGLLSKLPFGTFKPGLAGFQPSARKAPAFIVGTLDKEYVASFIMGHDTGGGNDAHVQSSH